MIIEINNLLRRKHLDFIEMVCEQQKDAIIKNHCNGTIDFEMDVERIDESTLSRNILVISLYDGKRYMIDKDDFLSIEIM